MAQTHPIGRKVGHIVHPVWHMLVSHDAALGGVVEMAVALE